MTTTPTSGAADLPEAGCSKHHLIHCSQCRHDNMVRDLRAENDRLTTQLAALAAGQATAAPAQPAAEHYGPLRDADAEHGKQLSVYSTPRAQPAAQQPHRSGCTAGTDEACVQRGCGTNCLAVSPQADSVLYDPKAVLDVFNRARAGSEKPVGYLRGIRAVIAHWESRPEPHRWMVPARADSVQEDAARLDWLNPSDMAALERVNECFEDGQGYDIPASQMKRMAKLGVVQSLGFGRYDVTSFGRLILGSRHLRKPLETVEECNSRLSREHQAQLDADRAARKQGATP